MMCKATLSFTLPPGFRNSALARICITKLAGTQGTESAFQDERHPWALLVFTMVSNIQDTLIPLQTLCQQYSKRPGVFQSRNFCNKVDYQPCDWKFRLTRRLPYRLNDLTMTMLHELLDFMQLPAWQCAFAHTGVHGRICVHLTASGLR